MPEYKTLEEITEQESGILHIQAKDFPWSSDPYSLGDSLDSDDDEMSKMQAWFDQRAPGVFQVVGVDYPGVNFGPVTVYYLVAKKDLPREP